MSRAQPRRKTWRVGEFDELNVEAVTETHEARGLRAWQSSREGMVRDPAGCARCPLDHTIIQHMGSTES